MGAETGTGLPPKSGSRNSALGRLAIWPIGQRQVRFLTYRGFSSDQVKAAMELDALELDANCD